ncbi:MAG: hypothetical protein A2V83_02055 [Nitrospirae bacterium RBG_16_64_22]|nr:MAG: hypothetical protein A2V83_02055 [Nitrospirae bacterium RBG_16_64_22]
MKAAFEILLPEPPAPRGGYVPAVKAGNLLFVSGMLPIEKGAVAVTGKVGGNVSIDEGRNAARLAVLNALAVVDKYGGGFENVRRIVKVTGYVNSAPGFTSQPQVVDGASELLVKLFGEEGRHARAAVGVAELPADAAVEIEMICEVG